MTDEELVAVLEKQRDVMVAVATGGPRVDDVNFEYKRTYGLAAAELVKRSIKNPNPYPDLWEWYGQWTSGDHPSWRSRRQFLAEMFNPTVLRRRNRAIGQNPDAVEEPTGWPKVDGIVGEIRKSLAQAQSEERFQATTSVINVVAILSEDEIRDRWVLASRRFNGRGLAMLAPDAERAHCGGWSQVIHSDYSWASEESLPCLIWTGSSPTAVSPALSEWGSRPCAKSSLARSPLLARS